MADSPLLRVADLQVVFPSRHGDFQAVQSVSFDLHEGEILGIVGESGAGKSTIGNAIAGLLTPPGYVADGQVLLDGTDLRTLDEEAMRRVRGKDIGFIFQDPMTSLNPLLTIGEQLTEPMVEHLNMTTAQARARAISLLDAVGIVEPEVRLGQYPHQFSGGMRQRVVIAIALSTHPRFVIADEPTTALDVSIQDQILQLLRKLCREQQVGCMLVTHDMGVVASVTDRVMVTYRGRMVEIGDTAQVLSAPQHEYSKSLIAAVPPSEHKIARFPLVGYIEDATEGKALDIKSHWLGQGEPLAGIAPGEPLLVVDNISLRFKTRGSLFPSKRRYVQAVNQVSFTIKAGESFGLVGESGSGKSTIARAITDLYPPDSGTIHFASVDITHRNRAHAALRRQMQMVFQNPYSSINPRMRVADIIADPIRFHRLSENEAQTRSIVADLIEHVGLARNAGQKFPHEFSGGQRQRISIARALASRPHLLICDEPTSALDVSVQAQILNLLKDLQEELHLTLLFISHDLPVIRQMCDRIGVMKLGNMVEINTTDQLFAHADDPYTRELIALMPRFKYHAA
ncbi:MAG: ABC transporter ATP-binding protein [Cardiobacteriaceae bacterium]|nr:ABC transporter ATP-binding protein [Cardiobacteriaceae bacterium]